MFHLRSTSRVVFCILAGCLATGPAYANSPQGVAIIKSFSLIDIQTNRPIKNFSPIAAGSVLPIKHYLPEGIAIRADTSPRRGNFTVKFRLDDGEGRHYRSVETKYPFLFKSGGAHQHRWSLKTGDYKLSAVVYSKNGKGPRITREQQGVVFSLTNTTGSPPIVRSNHPIPLLGQWEQNMQSFGRVHCRNLANTSLSFDTRLAGTYYDAEWVFYQIGDYTNDSTWTDCAAAAEAVYGDGYVIPNNGIVPGYWNFSHGVTQAYLRNHKTKEKTAAMLLAENASYAPDGTPLSWTENANMSREVAYAIMSYLNSEKMGAPHRARCEALVAQALGHLDQWFVSRTADYVRPFMFALTAQALISYDAQIGGHSKILPALKNGANWIWDHTWLPANHTFKYTDRIVPSGGTDPSPDLNLLIAPVFAWLWHQTGDPIFRDRADQIFAGGVSGAWLANGKQFDQNYRWSFDFVKWRSEKPLH